MRHNFSTVPGKHYLNIAPQPEAISVGRKQSQFKTWAAMGLLFLLAVSLPPKWATLHLAGLLLVFAAGFARREDWRSAALRTYLLCTALWLLPVLLTAVLQHAVGLASAPIWRELPLLVLRMLGVGLGLIVLIQRGWLSLRSASVALLAALALHAGAGLADWLAVPTFGPEAWRQHRLDGLAGNPNPFGAFMALTVILAAGLLRDAPRHPALWILLVVALWGVFGSASRAALMVTVLGLVVLFPPIDWRRGLVYLLMAAGLAALVWTAGPEGSSGLQASISASDNERMLAISFAFEQICLAPWLGWGIDAYAQLPGRVGPAAPHNMLLDLAVSSGLPALVGWVVSTMLLGYRLYRRCQPAAHLALALLAATVLAGALEYSLLVSTHYSGIWVIVTALACVTLGTVPVSRIPHASPTA